MTRPTLKLGTTNNDQFGIAPVTAMPKDDITRSTLCQFDWSSTDPVDVANAKLIVASVNEHEKLLQVSAENDLQIAKLKHHAQALAEAIGKIRTAIDRGLDLTPSIYGAIATLANWEGAQ